MRIKKIDVDVFYEALELQHLVSTGVTPMEPVDTDKKLIIDDEAYSLTDNHLNRFMSTLSKSLSTLTNDREESAAILMRWITISDVVNSKKYKKEILINDKGEFHIPEYIIRAACISNIDNKKGFAEPQFGNLVKKFKKEAAHGY